MPPCVVCDRRFANRDALVQHLATSSAWHPFCEMCNRRFISQEACDGHMTAKHPPMFPCTTCQRTFSAPFALDDHYRGSAAHPNCVKCGRGFLDAAGREEHQQTAHPPCSRCQNKSVCEETIEEHYLMCENHPSCAPCKVGFKDEGSETQHALSTHPERCCIPCQKVFENFDAAQNHYRVSTRHKQCLACNVGFQNDGDRLEHIQRLHADLTGFSKGETIARDSSTTVAPPVNHYTSVPRSRVFPERLDLGMTWRSQRSLPPPGRAVNALWAGQINQPHATFTPSRRVEAFHLASARTRAALGLGWSPRA